MRKEIKKTKLPPDGNLSLGNQDEIDRLTEEIIQSEFEFNAKTLQLFEIAVKQGKRILRLKELLPHGSFMKYCKANFVLIGRTTVNKYMALAENEFELREKLGESLELKKAYQYLSSRNKSGKAETKIEKEFKKEFNSHESKQKEYRAKRKTLRQVEKKLIAGEIIPEPDRTFAEDQYRKNTERYRKLLEKNEKLLSQITT